MNNFNNKDILFNRIRILYINKGSLKSNNINEIKKAVEQKLEHMTECLYNEFYSQTFIYEIKSENDEHITVQLVEGIDKENIKENMFIVNE